MKYKYFKHALYQQYYRVYSNGVYECFAAWCQEWHRGERSWEEDSSYLTSHGFEPREVSKLEVLIVLGAEAVKSV